MVNRHNRTVSAGAGAAMDATSVSGKCLCGSIAFQYTGKPNWTLHCHCENCRRATSSPITTWISVPRSAFAFTKGTPRYFNSSPGVRRGFCENCGSPLTYENEQMVGEIHLYAVSLLDAILCRRAATSSSMNNYLGSKRSMTCRGSQRLVAPAPRPFASAPGRSWIDFFVPTAR